MDAARNLAELKANNITHIVNAAAGLENAFPDVSCLCELQQTNYQTKNNLQMFYYYNLNALDIYDFDMLSLLPDCVKWMESACPGGVFVHWCVIRWLMQLNSFIYLLYVQPSWHKSFCDSGNCLFNVFQAYESAGGTRIG